MPSGRLDVARPKTELCQECSRLVAIAVECLPASRGLEGFAVKPVFHAQAGRLGALG